MESGAASRTAVFVCQGRATADGRVAVGRFADPVAALLLSDEELAPVRLARDEAPASEGRERFLVEAVRACAEVVAPRTVLIDDALGEVLAREPDAQVVLLGAGLDARPWRLATLRRRTLYSVDHPASQADLVRRSARLDEPVCDLRPVPVDLSHGGLAAALQQAGLDPQRPTAWVWEGVIPYLAPEEVRATVTALTALSTGGSVLVAQYQARSLTAQLGRHVSGVMARVSGVTSPLSDEPWRSTWRPDVLATVLDDHGWTVDADVDLLEAARRIGTPTGRSRSLAHGRVVTASRTR